MHACESECKNASEGMKGRVDYIKIRPTHCKTSPTPVFPVQMFEEGGKKILTPSFPAPRCAKMFKDEDKESGEVVCKETFQMVLISNLMPSQVRAFPIIVYQSVSAYPRA